MELLLLLLLAAGLSFKPFGADSQACLSVCSSFSSTTSRPKTNRTMLLLLLLVCMYVHPSVFHASSAVGLLALPLLISLIHTHVHALHVCLSTHALSFFLTCTYHRTRVMLSDWPAIFFLALVSLARSLLYSPHHTDKGRTNLRVRTRLSS